MGGSGLIGLSMGSMGGVGEWSEYGCGGSGCGGSGCGLVVVWLCKIAGNFGGHLGAKNTDPG